MSAIPPPTTRLSLSGLLETPSIILQRGDIDKKWKWGGQMRTGMSSQPVPELQETLDVRDYPSPGSDEMLVHKDFVAWVEAMNGKAKDKKVTLRSALVRPPPRGSQGMSAMCVRALRVWVVYSLALGFATGLAPAFAGAAASAASAPEADLQAARPFVLVVVDGDRVKRSEAYGDWQSYLQSFIERRRGELPVHRVTPERARKLLPNWPSGLRNATLFADRQGKGLLHRGLVLEPKVYQIGKDFAECGSLAPNAASFGLEPFNWKAPLAVENRRVTPEDAPCR